MAEPSTATGIAIGAGVITITGSIFGVHYDMLLAGFFGGLLSLSHLPPMSRLKVASTVGTAAVAAGFFGPVIATAALHYFPWLSELGDFLRLAAGAAIGISLHSIFPALIRRLSTLIGSAKNAE
jgi:hypothetical protein